MGKLYFQNKEVSRDSDLTIYESHYIDDKGNVYLKLKDVEQLKEDLIVSRIRKRYNINQELAILRQREAKPEEWECYNNYVEECKQQVKEEFGLL